MGNAGSCGDGVVVSPFSNLHAVGPRWRDWTPNIERWYCILFHHWAFCMLVSCTGSCFFRFVTHHHPRGLVMPCFIREGVYEGYTTKSLGRISGGQRGFNSCNSCMTVEYWHVSYYQGRHFVNLGRDFRIRSAAAMISPSSNRDSTKHASVCCLLPQ